MVHPQPRKSITNIISKDIIPSTTELSRYTNNQPMILSEFRSNLSIHSSTIHKRTAGRWLSYLGFNFRERNKSYFNDKHESISNVVARQEYIDTYFSLEIKSYRWVQISEKNAMEIEDTEGSLGSAHITFNRLGEEFREYHVDTHPCLFQYVKNKDMGGDLSVQLKKGKGKRPLILIDQDESVFKQYSFTKKHGTHLTVDQPCYQSQRVAPE